MTRKHLRLVAIAGLATLFYTVAPAFAQSLGAASSYAVLGAAGVTAAGGAGTIVTGDVGSSPTASITGFPPAVVVAPFGIHANDASAIAAQAATGTLFGALNTGSCADTPTPQMSGAVFLPGIHCFASAADLAAGSSMTLSGAGVYIFRVPAALTLNVGASIVLAGADPCSVFWQVGTAATLNSINSVGNVDAQAGVTLGVGDQLTGRAMSAVGPVTLSGNNTSGGCSTPASVPPVCPTITLSPSTLPSGTVGVAYSQTILGSGGAAPYSFIITSGVLPAGLTLTTTGVLAGTPIVAGSSPVTIRGTDSNGCFQTISYTIVIAAAPPVPPVCPAITLLPAALPSGVVGVAFTQTITGSGGAAPYSFGVTSGILPAGLTLTAAGVLAGTPTVAGSTPITIRGTDANGCFQAVVFTVVIAAAPPVPPVCPAITLLPATLPSGVVGIAYTQTLTGSGGTAPYSFGVTIGVLPAGVTLTSAGVLAGTPTAAGSSPVTIRATDANGCFQAVPFTLVIAAAPAPPPVCPAIALSPTILPNGTMGVPYSATISGSGGTAPYTFGVTSGALPAGLTLTSAGVLSGTMTSAGTSTFTIRGTDANGCAQTISYSIISTLAVPTLPVWAMIMLTALLACVGVFAMRRRTIQL